MTPEQHQLIQALNKIKLPAQSFDRRFIRSLTKYSTDQQLTGRQANRLTVLALRYRKALAEAGLKIELAAKDTTK